MLTSRRQAFCLSTSLISPKRYSDRNSHDWYPYYAGFSSSFATEIISKEFRRVEFLVDPWSGAGTTAGACVHNELRSVGVDINPAMAIIANARFAAPQHQANALSDRLFHQAQHYDVALDPREPLLTWLQPNSAKTIRALESCIRAQTKDFPPEVTKIRTASNPAMESAMSPEICIQYAALFSTVRELLVRFKTTNPMWLNTPTKPRRIRPREEKIKAIFTTKLGELQNGTELLNYPRPTPDQRFVTATSTSIPYPTDSFGGALSSPPYATRIDYIKGTLPELAVLNLDEQSVSELRKQAIGSPVVRGVDQAQHPRYHESPTIADILDFVLKHDSHGSKNYYYPWLKNYISKLYSSIFELDRIVIAGGPIAIVAQDSYYKSKHIDLQRIIIDMFEQSGRELHLRENFSANRLRSRMNPKARKHMVNRKNTESLMIFR